MALNRKIVLGQNLMNMGDYRLDHLIGFDLHGKKSRDYWHWKKLEVLLCKIMLVLAVQL
jgi:hypothetical protein